jgi:hypothetical protein
MEMPDAQLPGVVVGLLPLVLVETYEPEEPGKVKDWIRIVDVLAIGRADVVNLRPRTGVVEVDSYFAEGAEPTLAVDADVLADVDAVVDVDDVLLPRAVDCRSTLEDLCDEAIEVRHPVRLGPDAITEGRGDRVKLMNDAIAMEVLSGEIVAARNGLRDHQAPGLG